MSDLEQFRADFALVFRAERMHGHANDDEAKQLRTQAGLVVQEHMHDANWMRTTSAHYAEMADAIRHDQARADRIRNEVRADRARKAA